MRPLVEVRNAPEGLSGRVLFQRDIAKHVKMKLGE